MELQSVVALVVFLFPLAYSPGPGNSFFAAIGAARGPVAALPPLIGYHVATLIVTLLIGMGFGLALLQQPEILRYLSIVGSLYVFYLAWLFLREALTAGDQGAGIGSARMRVGFMDGVMILVFNPKAYLIIALLFSQFLTATDAQFGQVFAISMVFTLNNLIAFLIWTLAGATLSCLLGGGNSGRGINLLFSFCLFGVAIWLLLPLFGV